VIVVRVELWSAITGETTELARMHICNTGGTRTRGDYSVRTLRGRCAADLDKGVVSHAAEVKDYPRLAIHVWNLVARALRAMRYG